MPPSLNFWAPCSSARVPPRRSSHLTAPHLTHAIHSTIKNGIVPAAIFEDNAGLQLLGFVNAIFISSVWLTIATRLQFPVSTTYSIVSAIAGVGIALGGWDAPQWGWDNAHGLGAIFAVSGVPSPGLDRD